MRQLLVGVVVALIAGWDAGFHAALSALIGAGIGVGAGLAYAWRAVRPVHGDPKKAFQAQVLGEAYKIAVTLILFGAVFLNYREVAVLPLFSAYALTFVVYWMALLKQR
ncbi:MAG TPA: ATP synthase subunit I [Rhodocyclaceae bacterium]